MIKHDILKITLPFAAALSLSISLIAAQVAPEFPEDYNNALTGEVIFRKRDVQDQLLEKTLNQLNSIDYIFEELAQSVNNGAIKVADKKVVINHIIGIREFIAEISAQRGSATEKIAQLTQINQALMDHLHILVDNHLSIIPPFDAATIIKKSQEQTAPYGDLLLKLGSNAEALEKLIAKTRNAGKNSLNRFFTKTETFLKEKGILTAGKRLLCYVPLVAYAKYRNEIIQFISKANTVEKHEDAKNEGVPALNGFKIKSELIPLDLGLGALFTSMLKKDGKDLFNWLQEQGKKGYNKLKGESYDDPSPVKTSKLSFSDIVGYNQTKGQLSPILEYFNNKTMYDRTGTFVDRGYIFVGPFDMGKNLAHALAGEITKQFKAQNIAKKCGIRELHSSELIKKDIKDIIADTEQEAPYEPAIILIEDIDWLVSQANKDSLIWSNFAGAMSSALRGNKKQIFIIATSNRPELIDRTVKGQGRLGVIVQFDKPNKDERKEFITKELTKRSVRLNEFDTDKLAFLTEKCSYDTLTTIIKTACTIAGNRKEVINQQHIEFAIDSIVHNIIYNEPRRNDVQQRTLAEHYAGQALAHMLLKPASCLVKVTILPVATKLKDTFKHGKLITHEEDYAKEFRSDADLKKEVIIALAGIESVKAFGGTSSFAMVTDTKAYARALVRKIVFEDNFAELSKAAKQEKLKAVETMMSELTKEANTLVNSNQVKLETITRMLQTQRTVSYDELAELLK